MAHINGPIPGHFCWIELGTTDPEAAKKFYSDVFGWEVKENDMGEMGKYYIFTKNGRDAGAMYKLMPDQQAQGIPPNWLSYVGVNSADESVEKARTLGGNVLQPPFDVFDFGRMSVLTDPQGAVFAVWEAKQHWGVGVRDEADTLCWNELAARDAEGARQFYTGLFGWKTKISPEYTEWYREDQAIGGMRTIGQGEPTPPNWMPYFMVDSVDATHDKITAAAGKSCMPPTDMPNVGRFAVVNDPQGAFFALYKHV